MNTHPTNPAQLRRWLHTPRTLPDPVKNACAIEGPPPARIGPSPWRLLLCLCLFLFLGITFA